MRHILLLTCLLAACGGPARTPSEEPRDLSQDASVPLQVRAFHAELAPLWDAPAGDQRSGDTCELLSTLQHRAAALRSVRADQLLDAPAYAAAVDALEADLVALEEPCTTLHAGQFEEIFARVHGDFQSVTAALR